MHSTSARLNSLLLPGLCATLIAFGVTASRAAVIEWGPAQGITGDSDVSTFGSLVSALNLGTTESSTVIGVLFTGFVASGQAFPPVPGNTITRAAGNFAFTSAELYSITFAGSTVGPFSNLSPAYQILLGSTLGNSGFMTMAVTSLSVGSQYQLQFWSNNSNGSGSANATTALTAGNSLSLNDSPGGALGAVGQYGIGTFTADAATQDITIVNGGGIGIYVNAVQLRAIPEPGTALLLGVSLCSAFGRRRR